ncbi:hypothetical protein Ddye_000499 [Dipteronia dyeriana]|uniref:Putative plant transposon protein domain-containing protein n=1 Tax=Dipteronia dyeriana TaxID=168575 RepID=A0AAD9XMH4_9ROSI|nr:hypothetical protein Ddye_000499 [Dipteronia dyeriana]
MFNGVPLFDIFSRMNIDLANNLVAQPMEFWNSRSNPIKKKRMLLEMAFRHIFVSHSLRPCRHRTTIAYEVAILLYCLKHGHLLDVGVIVKMEINKSTRDITGKEAMVFPFLIIFFCHEAGVDMSSDEFVEAGPDFGIRTCSFRGGGYCLNCHGDINKGSTRQSSINSSRLEGEETDAKILMATITTSISASF